ncbi:hypothetical protein E4U22_006114 [Claviceps purpurea]|nr:hypothetical protein E4U11_002536 [Claviceps purpurea]KAG6204160.1 hypothetical protein E4U50_005377 [Claviceps purpurea]KAG6239542.1 hypothetical protein E4U25_000608 [Claviceps purpurea]KAG6317582.1 hypothetical protein E4U22_006114 [Claviceps purpurea]
MSDRTQEQRGSSLRLCISAKAPPPKAESTTIINPPTIRDPANQTGPGSGFASEAAAQDQGLAGRRAAATS